MMLTLLHGTTAANAEAIRAGGFRPSDPERVARLVETRYGLPAGAIYDHEYFQFPRKRCDLARVHFTTNPDTAEHYRIPEQWHDALSTAYRIMFPPGDDELARDYRPKADRWIAAQAAKLLGPGVTLEIELPWDIIGEHAFGNKLSRADFEEKLDGELPEVLSLPVAVLTEARIA